MRFAVVGMPQQYQLKAIILEQLAGTGHEFVVVEERHRERIDGGWAGIVAAPGVTLVLLDRFDADRAHAVLAEHGVDRVVALSDRATVLAAVLRERLGLPGTGADTERRILDKAAVRERLTAAGLSRARYRRTTVAELPTLDLAFPCVVKPTDLGGKICVELLHGPGDVAGFLARCAANRVFAGNDLVVEEYLPGREISVEGMVVRGEPTFFGVSERHHSGPPYFIGLGHDFHAAHDLAQDAFAYCRRIVAALGMDDCLLHIELMDDGGRLEVVEVHSRFGGTMICELVRRARGVRVFAHFVERLAGSAATVRPAPPGTPIFGQVMLCAPPGRLLAVEVDEELTADPRVLSVTADPPSEQEVGVDVVPVEAFGFALFAARDAAEAAELRLRCTDGVRVRRREDTAG